MPTDFIPVRVCILICEIILTLPVKPEPQNSTTRKSDENKNKTTEIQRISVVLVRHEGFEPPAFWSVACLRGRIRRFRPHLILFVQWLDTL